MVGTDKDKTLPISLKYSYKNALKSSGPKF